jgi:hypothetical protein
MTRPPLDLEAPASPARWSTTPSIASTRSARRRFPTALTALIASYHLFTGFPPRALHPRMFAPHVALGF